MSWPSQVYVGEITWSVDTSEDPTVLAERGPVTLARATLIHETISDSDAYVGAADFLETMLRLRTGPGQRRWMTGWRRCARARPTPPIPSTSSRSTVEPMARTTPSPIAY